MMIDLREAQILEGQMLQPLHGFFRGQFARGHRHQQFVQVALVHEFGLAGA